jgi:hypothetical protein
MLLNHGVIGNGRLLALVNPDTSIDWLCLPRFDSASMFARLLDEEKGGSFSFVADGMHTRMAYARNTNVLRTEVEVADGRFEVYDFAPRIPHGLSVEAPLEVHRLIRPLAGTPRIAARFRPAPDYAGEAGVRPDWCRSGNPRRTDAAVPPIEYPARLHRERLSLPRRSPALLRAQLGASYSTWIRRRRSIARSS